MAEVSDANGSEVVLQLLDAFHGGTLKTWKFSNRQSISIGRAEDRDVEIVDAYVSRHHASLEFRQGAWVLVAHGRNGIYVGGEPIQELTVAREVAFRLGSAGPQLVFRTFAPRDESLGTLSFDTLPASVFGVDAARLAADVESLTGRDEFARLQEQVRALRSKRLET
jgi:pSer/pThr/pTyr-binding forkhead associated (FHA) protein